LIQKWNLPHSMTMLALEHHEKSTDRDPGTADGASLRLMRIGEALANMIDVPSPQRNSRLQTLLRTYTDTSPTNVKICLAEAISTATEMKKIFAIPVPQGGDWNQLIEQIQGELEVAATPSQETTGAGSR
jgi:hypothetical protein